MNELVSYHIPEAIRIEVSKVDESDSSYCLDKEDVRRFSVDPQITDIATLQSIVVRAFNLKSDFSLNYLRRDIGTYVPLHTDWDLDAAYLNSSHPFLEIRMSIEHHNSLTDWDIITVADVTKAAQLAANQTHNLANTFLNRMERIVSRAFTNSNKPTNNESSGSFPLTERQYHTYLNNEGHITSMRELRISIYRRGVEPNLRKAVWKHLLNVYPPGLSGQQRIDYIKSKSEQYFKMCKLWRSHQKDPQVECIYNMVKKDVLRTDRSHPFYAGCGEENKNVAALLNILTTFALNHPARYCQGMSDLVSPLLYAMKDEAHAYICFCALMRRLSENFNSDGEAMSRKFDLLSQLLQYYDPEFYCYLRQAHAHELLFCYRWIFLELKREFAFDDALLMLEVLWSSIPPAVIADLPLSGGEEYQFAPGCHLVQSGEHFTSVRETMNSLSLNTESERSNRMNGKSLVEEENAVNELKKCDHVSHDTPLQLENIEQLLNNSTRLSSVGTVEKSTGSPKMNGAGRPLRKIRFLPKILSSDSKEIDSPDADDYNQQYYFPPKFIDKQFSVDDDDKPRIRSFDSSGSIEKTDYPPTESAPDDSDAKSKAILFQHSSATVESNSMDIEEFIAHCNGEYGDVSRNVPDMEWPVPRGLARNSSTESLKDSSGSGPECVQTQDKEKSEGYVSASVSENQSNCGFNGNKSNSSSCSSLVILSSTGSVVDSVCSPKLRVSLPSPSELGSNNAFMLFLCLTLLLQHRDVIISKKMDSNDIAMYFDGMIRRHNVHQVLDTGRHLFHSYLSQWHQNSLDEDLSSFYSSGEAVSNQLGKGSNGSVKKT